MQRRRHDGSGPAVHWLAALLLVVLGAAIWIGSRGGGTESSAEPEPARAELDEDRPVEELESVASIGEGRNPAAPDDPSVPRAAAPRGHADEPMVGVGGSIRGTATALTHSYHPELLYQVLAGIQPGETGKQIEARLGEAGPVLRKEARRALSGVEIVLSRSRPSEGVPAEQRALSDEAGAYAFDLLAPGDWEVRIVPGADLPRLRSDHRLLHRKLRLEPGEIRIVDFELPGEGAAVAGRVLDGSGRPLAGARVTAVAIADPDPIPDGMHGDPLRLASVTAETDEQGRYRLGGLLPASLQDAMEYVRAGRCFAGMYAVTAEADGLASARILAPPFAVHLERSARSIAEGLLTLAELMGVDERERASMVLDPDALPAPFLDGALLLPDLVLFESASVSGTVEDTRGELLPGAQLTWRLLGISDPADHSMVPVPVVPGPIVADDEGAFRVADLPPGDYEISVFAVFTDTPLSQRALNPPLSLRAGARIEGLRVWIQGIEMGTIAGIVADAATGESIDAFEVGLIASGGYSIWWGREGAFRIEPVPAGSAMLTIRAKGYAPEELTALVRGGAVTELHAALGREASVRGRLTLDGSPARGSVLVRILDDASSETGYVHADAAGQYRIDGLKSGAPHRLSVSLDLGTNNPGQLLAAASVVPQAGEETTQDFDLRRPPSTIRGTVTMKEEPCRWHVYAFEGGAVGRIPPEWDPSLIARVWGRDGPGPYELPVPAGSCAVLARLYEPGPAGNLVLLDEKTALLSLEPGETAELDFDFR